MVPSGILLSHYPVGPVASPRCVARSSYYFGESEVHYAASSSLLIFWDSQLTSDHLTQARAILRPVRPITLQSMHTSPLLSLRMPSREQTQSMRNYWYSHAW
ncbi:hypothetical protein M405DRAFT_829809 [Rhizopogon salebrosus TDB-379]|nr:hypothetical protein M405DRAFT_829809 [Rhizopogon salebrosus TDB-379]